MNVKQFFESMWQDYLELNPEAHRVYQLLSQQNEVVNDHIALRTFGVDGIRIEDIAEPLIEMGYQFKDDYYFEQKKLRARHLAHPDMPLIFISELEIEAFNHDVQDIIKRLVSEVEFQQVSKAEFLYSGRQWSLSSEDYLTLRSHSEYAAWVAAIGFRPNHFTVSVNHLKQFQAIEDLNAYLMSNGFEMNQVGGITKGSKGLYLEQSSTMANKVNVEFTDTQMMLPSCFYEFAQRHEMEDGQLFKGFIAGSADKIFQSTDAIAA